MCVCVCVLLFKDCPEQGDSGFQLQFLSCYVHSSVIVIHVPVKLKYLKLESSSLTDVSIRDYRHLVPSIYRADMAFGTVFGCDTPFAGTS